MGARRSRAAMRPCHEVLATLTCLVVAISDGDTIKARCNGEQVNIRLAEIDAPEKAQPFGQRSKQSLSDLCYQQQATIKPQAADRYGRTVARVTCNGIDANAFQVERGMAWVYRQYSRDPALFALERVARASAVGLWADPAPTPPWDWRRPPP